MKNRRCEPRVRATPSPLHLAPLAGHAGVASRWLGSGGQPRRRRRLRGPTSFFAMHARACVCVSLLRCTRELVRACAPCACHDACAATSIAVNAARSKKAVAYIRISTKTNAEKGGIERQRHSIKSCALGQKVKIVREVCDVVLTCMRAASICCARRECMSPARLTHCIWVAC
jgi:hypothetical protein